MQALTLIKEQINSFLNELNSPLTLELYKHLEHGKMLRSKLILNIAGDCALSIKLCAIIEMIQSASLLHDDVIDNAKTRRNKPSINALFGDKTSIMLGDILYSKAFSALDVFSNSKIPSIIADSVATLAVGELEDVELSKSFNENCNKYLEMITHKTAALIEASAYAAALLANKSDKSAQNFRIYGRNLGIAFQIIDDVLDIVEDSKTLGKPALSDFKEGKTTLPYIYLYETLEKKDREFLVSCFKKELDNKGQEWILSNLKQSGAIEKSIKLAQNLGEAGVNAIKQESCDKLVSIMQEMINRKF
ncbi:MAG: polyprenyl synthetase family protein [Helicobacteraceae bacterium]|nr:polyprenyl synthetase family protein [Helicobacteraceae bacterium]